MVAVGSDLYVGGFFESTGDYIKELGYIARYNIASKTWHALPNKGLDHHTQALEIVGDDLYVAGSFSATGDNSLTDLGFIARYDMTTKSWHSLPNKGVGSYSLWALERMGSDLYVGGNINQTGEGTLTDLGGIVRLSLDVQNWRYLPLVVKR